MTDTEYACGCLCRTIAWAIELQPHNHHMPHVLQVFVDPSTSDVGATTAASTHDHKHKYAHTTHSGVCQPQHQRRRGDHHRRGPGHGQVGDCRGHRLQPVLQAGVCVCVCEYVFVKACMCVHSSPCGLQSSHVLGAHNLHALSNRNTHNYNAHTFTHNCNTV